MRAIDAVHKQPVTIDVAATISDAAKTMRRETIGALVVTDGGCAVGIVTDRDLGSLLGPTAGQVEFAHPEPGLPVGT